MKRKPFFSARNIAYLAVLVALLIVLQLFASAIPVGAASLNFSLVPIVLGAILLGPAAGGFLGLLCGIIVFIQVVMGLTPFYTVIWSMSPFVTFLTCVVKTTVAGLVAGLVFRAIAKKSRLGATFAAAAVVPVINTALFILGCLCMNNAIVAFQELLAGGDASSEYLGMNIFVFIVIVLVTFNFFIELAINLVLAPAICRIEAIVNSRVARYRADREESAPAAGHAEQSQPESTEKEDRA